VRIEKLVVSLQKRLSPFVIGEEEAFLEVQSINAQQVRGDTGWRVAHPPDCQSQPLIHPHLCTFGTGSNPSNPSYPPPHPPNNHNTQLAAASFGEVLLQAIGGVYTNEAATFLGGGNPFSVGLQRLRRTGANLRSQLQVRSWGRSDGDAWCCWQWRLRDEWVLCAVEPTLLRSHSNQAHCSTAFILKFSIPSSTPPPTPKAAQAAVQLAQHQVRVDAADEALRSEAAALKSLEEAGETLPEEARSQLYGLMMARLVERVVGLVGVGWVVCCVATHCVLYVRVTSLSHSNIHHHHHRRAELEQAGINLALQAMWAANIVDIQKTLHQVCKRLLRDPGVGKEEARARAQALAELGRIFTEVGVGSWSA